MNFMVLFQKYTYGKQTACNVFVILSIPFFFENEGRAVCEVDSQLCGSVVMIVSTGANDDRS
jgi:hypothetical protein